jgi:hypothetical protein
VCTAELATGVCPVLLVVPHVVKSLCQLDLIVEGATGEENVIDICGNVTKVRSRDNHRKKIRQS